ncbi:hypothetical protein Ahy_A01g003230 [Arachis hypogaea]|uniref:RNase H type-1 domain-containing protein n=1 Tax=Arachis hypogaea TaxID=3818 RepID=A0A445ESW4_ARAHY|nr:hypothetical protein Ahy_A01g003230 [Arachis hypogaea]
MHAELWAVAHGLTIAATHGYTNLVVASDSAAAINFIKHGCSPTHHCAPLVQDIRNLAARLQQTSWIHALREANTVADQLAKKGHDLSLGLHLFDKAPPNIEYALLCDCIGTLMMVFLWKTNFSTHKSNRQVYRVASSSNNSQE